jgi:hypothetical protein
MVKLAALAEVPVPEAEVYGKKSAHNEAIGGAGARRS